MTSAIEPTTLLCVICRRTIPRGRRRASPFGQTCSAGCFTIDVLRTPITYTLPNGGTWTHHHSQRPSEDLR
jgi:hypothetical protein